MFDTIIGTAADAGAVAVRAVVAVAGVFVEMNGLRTLGTGDQVAGLWMAAVGCLLLAVCFVLARELVRGIAHSAA